MIILVFGVLFFYFFYTYYKFFYIVYYILGDLRFNYWIVLRGSFLRLGILLGFFFLEYEVCFFFYGWYLKMFIVEKIGEDINKVESLKRFICIVNIFNGFV